MAEAVARVMLPAAQETKMRWWQIRKRDADLERELRSDLDLKEEEQRDRGLSSEEARSAARRAFGNPTLLKEQTHEAWSWAPFERLSQDVRYGLRQLRRAPASPSLRCRVRKTVEAPYLAKRDVGKATAPTRTSAPQRPMDRKR